MPLTRGRFVAGTAISRWPRTRRNRDDPPGMKLLALLAAVLFTGCAPTFTDRIQGRWSALIGDASYSSTLTYNFSRDTMVEERGEGASANPMPYKFDGDMLGKYRVVFPDNDHMLWLCPTVSADCDSVRFARGSVGEPQ